MKVLLLLFIAMALTGCTTTIYQDKDVAFKRSSFLTVGKFSRLEKTKDGLVLEGYVNDQISGAAAITKAAIEAAVSSAK